MKKQFRKSILSFGLWLLLASPAQASSSPEVAVTIPPLHSLVQGVMGKTGKARLLIHGPNSPHDYQLKPSVMSLLQNVKIVFYIGKNLEISLAGALDSLPEQVRKVPMNNLQGISTLDLREDKDWESHDHAAHEAHEEEEHEEAKKDGHDDHAEHRDHDDHEHGKLGDPHIWLDPVNAITMVKAITKELSRIYPENRSIYKTNALSIIAQINKVDKDIESLLAPVKSAPFIVFHDAYQYFEKHYGLTATGSIVVDPSRPTSVKRVKKLRQKVNKNGALCIFREPQFSNKLSLLIADGTKAKLATIDPVGADLEPGAALYPALLMNMANSLRACLQP